MNVKILVFALSIIFIFIFINLSYSQIRNGDILLGVSGTYETKNEFAITSINLEYEVLDVNSAVLGIGFSGKYCNFSNTTNKNFFITANANLNFNKVFGNDFVPFAGVSCGTNLELKDNLYGANVGCRYIIEKDIILLFKNNFTNRDALSPEIGIEYRF